LDYMVVSNTPLTIGPFYASLLGIITPFGANTDLNISGKTTFRGLSMYILTKLYHQFDKY
jgi:hypothetical protein